MTAVSQQQQPSSFEDMQKLLTDAGYTPGQVYTDEEYNQIADKVVSATGKGDASDIATVLQNFQSLNEAQLLLKITPLLSADVAFVPPPTLSDSAAGAPAPNEFFQASFNTAAMEVALQFIAMLKENDMVMGELAEKNLAAMFSSAFARADNEIKLGDLQAAKDIAEGVASMISGMASLATAGMSIKSMSDASAESKKDIKTVVRDREIDVGYEKTTLGQNRSVATENGQGMKEINDGKSYLGRSAADVEKEVYDLKAKKLEIKAGALGKANAKTQIYNQISTSVEGITRAVSSFLSASYDKEMGQVRAENIILEAGQKAAEQAWNKALDSIYKSNAQDRDAMANFLKEVMGASARIGTQNA